MKSIPKIEYVSETENKNKVRQAIAENRPFLGFHIKKIFGINNTAKKPHSEKNNNYIISALDIETANKDTKYINPEGLYLNIIQTKLNIIQTDILAKNSETIDAKTQQASHADKLADLTQNNLQKPSKGYDLNAKPHPLEADFYTLLEKYGLWIDDKQVYKNKQIEIR